MDTNTQFVPAGGMTVREIADLCEVDRTTVLRWAHKVPENGPKQNDQGSTDGDPGQNNQIPLDRLIPRNLEGIAEKLAEAEKSGKEPATFTLAETLAIIGEGGGKKTLASLLRENALSKDMMALQSNAGPILAKLELKLANIATYLDVMEELLPLLPRLKALPATQEEVEERVVENAKQGHWHKPFTQFVCPYYGRESMPDTISRMLGNIKELEQLASGVNNLLKVNRPAEVNVAGFIQQGYDTLNVPIARFVVESIEYTDREKDWVLLSDLYAAYLPMSRYPVSQEVFGKYLGDHYPHLSVTTKKFAGAVETVVTKIRIRQKN
jgi:hypothetical protein